MDTTPPDREFCARGEQLYVEAQLDLACWRRSYPQIEHLKAAVADRLAQYRDACVTKYNFKRNLAMTLYSGLGEFPLRQHSISLAAVL